MDRNGKTIGKKQVLHVALLPEELNFFVQIVCKGSEASFNRNPVSFKGELC